MPEPLSLSALLIEAPVGRHFAQLHRHPRTLTTAVGQFVETGLQRGNGVAVIASATHAEELFDRLTAQEIDVESFRRCGRLVVRDAESMLDRIMVDGMPDRGEFRRTIGEVLESVHEFGRPAPRAYGEMVNLLWRDGRTAAAVRLEEFWNELAGLYPFGLFCGYMLDSQNSDGSPRSANGSGRGQQDVFATPDDEQFRTSLDEASQDVFGIPLSRPAEESPLERVLPTGEGTLFSILRDVPASSAEVLERARTHYREKLV